MYQPGKSTLGDVVSPDPYRMVGQALIQVMCMPNIKSPITAFYDVNKIRHKSPSTGSGHSTRPMACHEQALRFEGRVE